MSRIVLPGGADLATLARHAVARGRQVGRPATRDLVLDLRDQAGKRVKVVVDQLGNITQERSDGLDAIVILPLIRVRRQTEEYRG